MMVEGPESQRFWVYNSNNPKEMTCRVILRDEVRTVFIFSPATGALWQPSVKEEVMFHISNKIWRSWEQWGHLLTSLDYSTPAAWRETIGWTHTHAHSLHCGYLILAHRPASTLSAALFNVIRKPNWQGVKNLVTGNRQFSSLDSWWQF